MNLFVKKLAFFSMTLILWNYSVSADPFKEQGFEAIIHPADDSSYFELVLPRIKQAEESIRVIMFLASYYSRYPDSPTNLILQELTEAKKRGVDVKVILNRTQGRQSEHITSENLNTGMFLAKNGVPAYLDSESVTTHCKLVIIDRTFVIMGSANWTYSAMARNNETSVLILSKQLAGHYMEYFERVKEECRIILQPGGSGKSEEE